MQTVSDRLKDKVRFLVGNAGLADKMPQTAALVPFDDKVTGFLEDLSHELMSDSTAKSYSDITTFAFGIRRSSLSAIKERFTGGSNNLRLGRGTAFHIAPSNVPLNFAYSLTAGLLAGNANIVRIPAREFPQTDIVINAINTVLERHEDMKPYLLLVKYERDKDINDAFSALADARIVWGGDNTINELRRSPIPPRAVEITFADRYSLAVIDSGAYLSSANKERTALAFYNDTYLSDQNACTSPKLVVWSGPDAEQASDVFWKELHGIVKSKYDFKAIQAVDKLTNTLKTALAIPGCRAVAGEDNLITRIRIPRLSPSVLDCGFHSGSFLEYMCGDITELYPVCNDKRVQTIGYIGKCEMFDPLLKMGIKGVDRIVPVGKTMDFDLIWDGYDLISSLTRIVGYL